MQKFCTAEGQNAAGKKILFDVSAFVHAASRFDGYTPPVSAPLLAPTDTPPGYPLYPPGYIVSVLTISVLTAVGGVLVTPVLVAMAWS